MAGLARLMLAGLAVLAILASGCSGDSDDPAGDSDDPAGDSPAPEAGASDSDEDSGTGAVAPDREAAIAAIADQMTVMPAGPGIFFNPSEARCLAERVVDETDPAFYADIAADPGMEQPDGQSDIDTSVFLPDCIDSLARYEEMMTEGVGAETAACMTEGAGAELAYAIAVGPFFGEDISGELQGEQADLFEACNSARSG